jgi:hypothetical protein
MISTNKTCHPTQPTERQPTKQQTKQQTQRQTHNRQQPTQQPTNATTSINKSSIKCPVRGMMHTYTSEDDWNNVPYVDILSKETCETCGTAALVVHKNFPDGAPDSEMEPEKYVEYRKFKTDHLLACRFYNTDPYNYIDIDLKDQTLKHDELEKRIVEIAEKYDFLCVEKSISGGYHIIVQTYTSKDKNENWVWTNSVYDIFNKVGIIIDKNCVRTKSLLYLTGNIIWTISPDRHINIIPRTFNPEKKKNNTSHNAAVDYDFIINDEEATDEQINRLKNRLENDELPKFEKKLKHNNQYPFIGGVQALGYDEGSDVWEKVRYAVDHTKTGARHNDCDDLTILYNWLFPEQTDNNSRQSSSRGPGGSRQSDSSTDILIDYDNVIKTTDKYLSTDTYSQIVENVGKTIVQKSLGYGMTTKILENPFKWQQIVIIPTKSVIIDKVREMREKGIDVINGSEDYPLVDEIERLGDKAFTIMTTPEKFKKSEIIEMIQNRGIKVIYDEIHTMHTTADYRFLSDIWKQIKSVLTLGISSTPLLGINHKNMIYDFNGIEYTRIDNNYKLNLNVVNIEGSLLKSAKYMIDKWIKIAQPSDQCIIHLYVESLSDAHKIVGHIDPSKIHVYCSDKSSNHEKIKEWGWTKVRENETWDACGIYIITPYGEAGKNGAFSDGSGKCFKGLSILKSAMGTVQCMGRVRDINRDACGGYNSFTWMIKPLRKTNLYQYNDQSTSAYFHKTDHDKFKNFYEYENYLIVNDVDNIMKSYFDRIGINIIKKHLDDNIKPEDLNIIIDDIKTSGNKVKYNINDWINAIVNDDNDIFNDMIKSVSDGGRKEMLYDCRRLKIKFKSYIDDIKTNKGKLSFKIIEDFYYQENEGYRRVKAFMDRCAREKKTIDALTIAKYFKHDDVKIVNEFMLSLMKPYCAEIKEDGFKSYKRYTFNGFSIRWDKIMSYPLSKTQSLIELSISKRMLDAGAAAETDAVLDMIFNSKTELVDNKKEYEGRYEGKYEGRYEGKYEYYSVVWRGDSKKFSVDKDKRNKQYEKVAATAEEIEAVEQFIINKYLNSIT